MYRVLSAVTVQSAKTCFGIVFCALLIPFLSVWATSGPTVYKITIDGVIDLGLVPYVKRVIGDAGEKQADAIVVEINTLGGRLDAMIEIRDAILDAKPRVIGYVNKRAISAGALIALACKELYVAPGASIGAATPVSQEGVKASEKVVSFARTEFKTTAERNNRPGDIAMAMVDEDVEIKDLIEKGKLLTLTSDEAVKYKVADGIFDSLDELLSKLGFESSAVQSPGTNWAEKVVRILNNPVLGGILLTLGMLGLIAEVTSAGWGIPGTIGLVAFLLYFGSHFMVGLVGVEELVLLMAGGALMLLEVFIIPGFGVAGILGILCLTVGVVLSNLGHFPTSADISKAIWVTILSIVLAVIGTIILFKAFQKRPFWSRISLASTQKKEGGYVSAPIRPEREGHIGVAVTHLRPSGVGLFDEERLDVITGGDYIEAGENIKIVKDEGYRVVVKKTD